MTLNIGSKLNGEKMAEDLGIGATAKSLVKVGADRYLGGDATAAEFWLPGALDPAPDADVASYKAAMRLLAGGVAVITVGVEDDRTGFTATSVVSLSAEPPRLMFGISQNSSSWNALTRHGNFAVSLLDTASIDVADRFAGRGGTKGLARYEGVEWIERKTGVETLASALAGFDCEVEEVILRYDHAIVIGRVKEAWLGHEDAAEPLVYWRGKYQV